MNVLTGRKITIADLGRRAIERPTPAAAPAAGTPPGAGQQA